jgi:hypothetical protein
MGTVTYSMLMYLMRQICILTVINKKKSAEARYFYLLQNVQTALGPVALPIQGVTAFSPGNTAAGE